MDKTKCQRQQTLVEDEWKPWFAAQCRSPRQQEESEYRAEGGKEDGAHRWMLMGCFTSPEEDPLTCPKD